MDTLEDLLVEEGFKAGKMRPRSRASPKADATTTHRHQRSRFYKESPLVYITCDGRTKRTKSDVAKRTVGTGTEKSERPRISKKNISASGELYLEGRKKVQEFDIYEERDFGDMHEVEEFNVETFNHRETMWNHNEQVGTGFYEETFNNRATPGEKHVDDLKLRGITMENLPTDEQDFGRRRNKSTENGRSTCKGDLWGTVSHQYPGASSSRPNKSSQKFKVANNQAQREKNFEYFTAEIALNEVAIQATVSILSGYIKSYIKDKKFREMLYHNCLSCLGLNSWKDPDVTENGVLSNLKQAIETIEEVVLGVENSTKLKKASLQLSVIAGLNTRELKDGFTSSIHNSHLAACAHIYLGVIYKLQKKDRICSKHLLQVFCESPYQARSCLLRDLWKRLFLPHLSHLRVWYDQETKAVTDTSSRLSKMEIIKEVYDEAVDSSTYQFAVYYKEWLTDGTEAPVVPSVSIPTISAHRCSPRESCEPSPRLNQINSIIQMPPMSRNLFEPVDIQSGRTDEFSAEPNDVEDEDAFSSCTRSLESMREEKEHINNNYHKKAQVIQEDPHKNMDGPNLYHKMMVDMSLIPTKEAQELIQQLKELDVRGKNAQCHQPVSADSVPHQLSHAKANELTLKKLAKAVFQLPLNEESIESISTASSYPNSNVEPLLNSGIEKIALPSTIAGGEIPTISTSGESCGHSKYCEDTTFFSSIPKDFICPLSSQLFENPVTLEAGYTFERAAIANWFSQGNRTCPATGITLQYIAVPVTNLLLKHVVDGWKSEYCKSLLILANQLAEDLSDHKPMSKEDSAIMILQMLLAEFNSDEKLENAKLLISLGGLQSLIRRFEQGEIHEKAHIAALLTCCIKADGNCRNYIARSINKLSLVDILHSDEARYRTNAVLLLVELICLHRQTSVTSFLGSLQREETENILKVLLTCLQESQPEQKALVAVLLLNFDHLIIFSPEITEKNIMCREEAVDAITVALNSSLTDEKIRKQTCRALSLLGGPFSTAGEPQIETWMLKNVNVGFHDNPDNKNDDMIIEIDQLSSKDQDQEAREEWLNNLALTLLSYGRRPFLKAISKCLSSTSTDLQQTCLTTVAWLSHFLCSTSATEFQLKAFSFFVPKLKACLESEQAKNKELACMTLLNFTKISECRVLLCSFAEQIIIPVKKLADTTWMAKQLLSVISKDNT